MKKVAWKREAMMEGAMAAARIEAHQSVQEGRKAVSSL